MVRAEWGEVIKKKWRVEPKNYAFLGKNQFRQMEYTVKMEQRRKRGFDGKRRKDVTGWQLMKELLATSITTGR